MYIMMTEELIGDRLKRLRLERKLSQRRLSLLSGVNRVYINSLEKGRAKSITLKTAERLAKGLNVAPEIFFEHGDIKTPPERKETPEDLLEKLRLVQPVAVPVYTDYPVHAGNPVEPIEYVYLARPKTAPKGVEGYLVHGNCLEPIINDGDIVIVDRNAQVEKGDIVLCLLDNELHVAKYVLIDNEPWLENRHGIRKVEDCKTIAVVMEAIKRIKGRTGRNWS